MSEISTPFREQLISMAKASPWLMPALKEVRNLGLPSWCIGAGAIRNLVWDSLHGFDTPSKLPDIDVAYFNAQDFSSERDTAIQNLLINSMPELPWEVTNQAAVHLWFKEYFGYEVLPLKSLEDAVASWPEFATSVGLTLLADNTIEVIAPHGLDDLFSIIVRRNPSRVSVETYHQRIIQKRYSDRWPKVTIYPG